MYAHSPIGSGLACASCVLLLRNAIKVTRVMTLKDKKSLSFVRLDSSWVGLALAPRNGSLLLCLCQRPPWRSLVRVGGGEAIL